MLTEMVALRCAMPHRRLLVTGGAGYLGAEVVRQAARCGWDVIATYRTRLPDRSSAQILRLDIRDEIAVRQAFAACRPEVVIHTAFEQGGPDLWAITAEGAGCVARSAWHVGARLVHLSSDAVFDGERLGQYTEDDAPAPLSLYGKAKAAAEQLVMHAHPDALVVRTSLLYGGATLSKHEQAVLDALDGRVELTFFVDEMRCPMRVDDLASALLEAMVCDIRGPLHVAGGDCVSRYTFARLIALAHGRDPERLLAGELSRSGLPRPRNCALDCRLAQSLLHVRLRGVCDVLGVP